MRPQYAPWTNPEGSLKIYEPANAISKHFFAPEQLPTVNGAAKPKPYLRQESIIDRLANKDEKSQDGSAVERSESNNEISPKPTSIEFIMDSGDPRQTSLK
jgi:hypothetical protein